MSFFTRFALCSVWSACLLSNGVNAQHRCGFDHFVQHQREHNPAYFEAYRRVLASWKAAGAERGGGGVYVLPVVFHVVYHEDNQNVPDSVIYSQLEVLNEDYRRLNADAVNTRDAFMPVAADCEIEFQLAQTDPDGNPTTGITHTYTEQTGFSLDLFGTTNTLDAVKDSEQGGVDAWDTDHYINIWVCNIEPTFFGQIFGLAYPPAGLDNWPAGSSAPSPELEGVIVHYTTVGRNNPFAAADGVNDNDMGRTCTHELGHYLGLRHTWGDELFFDVCSEDDGIADTPLCGSGDQYACDYTANSCDEGTGDLPDQLENYMDYTRDECYNMFTQEQKSLMRYVIEILRPELLEGVGLKEACFDGSISVFPNPASDWITCNFGKSPMRHSVLFYDMNGKCVKTMQQVGANTRIYTGDLPPGLYAVTLGDNRHTVRVVIQRP